MVAAVDWHSDDRRDGIPCFPNDKGVMQPNATSDDELAFGVAIVACLLSLGFTVVLF